MSSPLLRIGAVSYLNTKPLVFHLQDRAPQAEVIFDLPSRLADNLADGRLDVALIPSIELFQNPDYRVVSDACIGCRGPVLSVKLLSRVPFPQINTLALDEGSRTSIALSRILLKRRFDLEPQTVPLPMDAVPQEAATDAVLVIGDRAIHACSKRHPYQWDLGEQWCRWTKLPFVFALWVAHRDRALGTLAEALASARDEGVRHLPEIASDTAAMVDLSTAACLAYLRDNLYFFFGQRERQGLARFYHHAVELGLAPRGLTWLTLPDDSVSQVVI